jgi:hypothetical protein
MSAAPRRLRFGLRRRDARRSARTGVLETPHGGRAHADVHAGGHAGQRQDAHPAEVAATGARIVLGNTYHLWLRPGPEVVASAGGLHGFTRWPHAMLTDSGGFQAFSLAERAPRRRTASSSAPPRRRLEALTPEVAMQVQGSSAPTSRCSSTSARPATRRARRSRRPARAPRAGPRAASPRVARRRRCSASCRAAPTWICARPTRRSSARCPSTAWPSAASASASRSSRCTRSLAEVAPPASTRRGRAT